MTPPPAPGSGVLVLRRVGARTVVESARAASPLKLLTPDNHGDGAWAFVANFGGGLVDGDSLRLAVEVRERATAFVGTQSSTKVYRGAGEQHLDAHVATGALLVALPDPVSCFAGATYTQHASLRLDAGASLVFLDGFTCGRSAHGERWLFDRYASRTVVEREGRRAVVDATVLDPAHGSLASRMGRFDAFATLVVVGPAAQAIRLSMLGMPASPALRASRSDRPDCLSAASPLGDDGAILRVAATSTERAARAIREALAPLPSLLGDDPFARKW